MSQTQSVMSQAISLSSALSSATFIMFLVLSIPFVDARGLTMPELSYEYDALEPMISKETVKKIRDIHEMHIGNVNMILHDGRHNDLQNHSMEDIIVETYRRDPQLFNSAALTWNLSFFWKSISPHKPTDSREPDPRSVLGGFIRKDFGSFAMFHQELEVAANAVFGSGWLWVVYDVNTGKLRVMAESGVGNPLTASNVLLPILVIDMWEHAYFNDYFYRGHYVKAVLDLLINWEFAEQNLETAVLASNSGAREHREL